MKRLEICKVLPPCSLEQERNGTEDQSSQHRPSDDDLSNLSPRASSAVQQPAANRSTSSNNGATQESRTASRLDTIVEGGLAGKHGRVGETWGVCDGRLEVHVGGHDLLRAGGAELVAGEVGGEVEEEEVIGAVRGHVRDERDLVVPLRRQRDARVEAISAAAAPGKTNIRRGGRSRVEAADAVPAAVVLGADGRLEGDNGVEDVVGADDVGVDGRRELGGAVSVEGGEQTANGRLVARRGAAANVVERRGDGRCGDGAGGVSGGSELGSCVQKWARAGGQRGVGVEGSEE